MSYTEGCGYGRIAANDTALFFGHPKLILALPGDWEFCEFVLDASHKMGWVSREEFSSWMGRRGMGDRYQKEGWSGKRAGEILKNRK